jgi:hypothetical protein
MTMTTTPMKGTTGMTMAGMTTVAMTTPAMTMVGMTTAAMDTRTASQLRASIPGWPSP